MSVSQGWLTSGTCHKVVCAAAVCGDLAGSRESSGTPGRGKELRKRQVLSCGAPAKKDWPPLVCLHHQHPSAEQSLG